MSQTRALAPTFPCSPVTHMNERVWGVFQHQAESHLTHCSQLVPCQPWLDTRGMPDPAEAVLEGSALLQSISDLSNLTGLRLFSSLHSGKSKRISFLVFFLLVWKTAVPVDHMEGEGCRGMQQQAFPTCSAHVHPQCCGLSAGSGQAVLLATVPGLAGTRGSCPPVTECF